MERELHTLVAFGIMPLFALANAGVQLGADLLDSISWAVTLGVVLGLVVEKPLGITLFAWGAARAGVAAIPAAVSPRALHGVSWLGGIGFTMSLFIAGLAFRDARLLDSAKVGILGAWIIAGVVGWRLLRTVSATRPAPPEAAADHADDPRDVGAERNWPAPAPWGTGDSTAGVARAPRRGEDG